MALLAVTQDLAQPLRADLQRPMPVCGPGRNDSKLAVEALHKARQVRIASIDVADAGQPQLLYQAVLQRPVHPLAPALGLAGVGAEDLDVLLGRRSPDLRHALAVAGLRPGDAER